jgi:hypothetical protein
MILQQILYKNSFYSVDELYCIVLYLFTFHKSYKDVEIVISYKLNKYSKIIQ